MTSRAASREASQAASPEASQAASPEASQAASPEASRAEGAHVQARALRKRYGSIAAVRGVDLEVRPGELVWVTGRSGSGKSTLLNLIGGLEQPDAGEVLIDGQAVWRGRRLARLRRTLVGFVFQHHLLLPMLTARANVEVPLIGAGVRRHERAERALALLDEVSLADRAHHRPDQLSGGERQRVAVARALVNEPRLLLADEPTGALDSTTSERLLDLLFAVRERHRTTIIMVSYDPLVGKRADRVYSMIDGLLEAGPAAPAGDGGAGGHGLGDRGPQPPSEARAATAAPPRSAT